MKKKLAEMEAEAASLKAMQLSTPAHLLIHVQIASHVTRLGHQGKGRQRVPREQALHKTPLRRRRSTAARCLLAMLTTRSRLRSC